MKRLFSLVLFCSAFTVTSAFAEQIFGKTADGKEIILDTDGTWKYAPEKQRVSGAKLIRDSKATTFVKSKLVPFGVWIDPEAWKISTKKNNEDAEFEFSYRAGDVYALMINEGLGLSYDYMKNFLVEHFNEGDDVEEGRLVREEERMVNGLPVTYLQFDVLIHKVPFSVILYVYIGENETIQLMAFTTTKQLAKYQPAIENFLNGLGKAE